MIRLAFRLTLALALLLPAVDLSAQARPLDHDAYDRWNRIDDETLAPNGQWVAYVLQPGDGDGELVLRDLDQGREIRWDRGQDPAFTDDSRYVVFRIAPAQDSVEALEERAEEDGGEAETPGDTLAVVELASVGSGEAVRIPDLESFRLPEEGPALVAYRLDPPEDEEEESDEEAEEEEVEEEAAEEEEEEEEEERDKPDGHPLVLRDLDTGEERRFEGVSDYAFTEDGRHLYLTTHTDDGEGDGFWRVPAGGGEAVRLLDGDGIYTALAVNDATGAAAVLSDREEEPGDDAPFSVWVAEADDDGARRIVGPGADGIPEGWSIPRRSELRFSESGARLFFGTALQPEEEDDGEDETGEDAGDEEPTLEEELLEEVDVDVWNWKDGYLQPMQLVQLERERERTYLAMVPAAGGSVVQLETRDLPSVSVGDDGDADVALGETDGPYRQLISWDGRYQDVWVVEVESGERRRVVEKIRGYAGASLSPEGRWIFWWDGEDRTWYAADPASGEAVDMTGGIPHPVHDLLDDRPEPPGPYGTAGWSPDDELFLVYDAHDIWAVDPAGAVAPRNLTEGVGRREGLRFRYVSTDPQADHVPLGEEVLLSSFHVTEKSDGFYRDRFDGAGEPTRLIHGDYALSYPRKAEDAERFLLTRQTFRDFPDLHVTDGDFGTLTKVSDANPQQSEYRWGSARLVDWTSADGIPLQGILYTPDGFDPSREYPMMVYFYERSSDGLHRYTVPSAGSSSINRSFYVSRGYLLFVPDIPYAIGAPGESALDAVVPGVLSLVEEGFVDRDRIGVQGHSWGGYQIAYMVTRTDLFAAAEAGAPVSNMTSAYGGIRWGSGMSRQFQYEQTQSRIGGHLWDAQHLYIENSPLFRADRIETPLLMMHNDEDGAVPWYQGIEMFTAMRRLGKPVWLLNYNGEAHGLRQEANREDWAIRMQQFFDHYLMDAPAPVWLAEGVPAVEKGETLGLEPVSGGEGPATEAGGGDRPR
jgi:dipeptidyl aminopeptidase/acylaminoacyl peptidase